MQIELDPSSEVPMYQQIRDRVVEAVASGDLAPGERLTPVRTLAGQFGVNVATVGKAYELLRLEGVVATNRAQGTVVTQPAERVRDARAARKWEQQLRVVLADALVHGQQPDAVRADAERVLAGLRATALQGGTTQGGTTGMGARE